MGVYVMLSFDNDDEAHEFVKATLRDKGVMYDGYSTGEGPEIDPVWIDGPYVRGVWKRPTIFCTCDSNDRKVGFTRGRKYGWWVHAKCGKPSKLWGAGNAWHPALGRNLLPQSELAPEYRSPENAQDPKWADLEDLLNPNGPATFVNDDMVERMQRMVREGHSQHGPLHKGVVRRNEV
jgi:hypothetical protein